MPKHTFYKVISFILLPIAALLAALDLMVLMSALANPPMLLPVFMLACVAIYVFTSFTFLNKVIIRGGTCKPSLKDWIKVNAIVTIVFAGLGLIQAMVMLNDPLILSQLVDQALAMQPDPSKMPRHLLLQAMKGVLYFFGALSVLLLIHITITFRLLKRYRYVFEVEQGS